MIDTVLFSKIILLLSCFIQCATALYALWLIRITGLRYSWIFISTALFFMALRRLIPFFNILADNGYHVSLPNEIIGLILSLFMLFGVHGLRSILSAFRDSEANISRLLEEKKMLLREVHHRIKNNMNTITSLLSMQADTQKNESTGQVLADAASRVRSMQLLYEKIYRSEGANLLSVKDYFPDLIQSVVSQFPQSGKVTLHMDLEDVELREHILSPLGILINELLTNSMKYAFAGREAGTITVVARREENLVILHLADDGIGLPKDNVPGKSGGFGLNLVSMLAQQIGGTLDIQRSGGTSYTLTFNP